MLSSTRFWCATLILMCVGGCVRSSTNRGTLWVDSMIQQLELAVSLPQAKGHAEPNRRASSAAAVSTFFPVGSHLTEIAAKLHHLERQGFKIMRCDQRGCQDWPAGVKRPHQDDDVRRILRNTIPPGAYSILATKTWTSRWLVEEFCSVSILLSESDARVISVEGHRSATFL